MGGRMSDALIRAAHAKHLLEDPLLVEALATIRQEAVETWVNSAAADDRVRENAWHTVKAVGRLEQELRSIVTNGAFEERRAQKAVP